MAKNDKLLIICGSTATGKTALALKIATKFDAEIVSADSRQVFKHMDIVTGKDIPKGSKFIEDKKTGFGYWETPKGVRIWGYDLVEPKRKFSVSTYLKNIDSVLKNISKKGKLAIVVGGTGLYIKGIVEGIPTSDIPINKELRNSLEQRDRLSLFDTLANLDPIKAAGMNYSDRNNPRRLIRAIEIAQWRLTNTEKKPVKTKRKSDREVLVIGLRIDKESLKRKINSRTEIMLRQGAKEEIEDLMKMGVTFSDQSMQTIGYKEWKKYFEKGKDSVSDIKDRWIKNQINYAKRQMTWFKNKKNIIWFDSERNDLVKNVENTVKKWYI